jgi:spore germination cell wall hydrolase CwlJ-like protein
VSQPFEDLEEPEPSRLGRLTDWLRTEAGGWTVVAVLTALVVALLTGFVLTRASGDKDAATTPAAAASQAPAGPPPAEFVEFTLAPEALQQMSADDARAWNAKLPFSTEPNPPMRRFLAPASNVESYARALDCLTAAIYYEAGAETPEGQAAVAQVVLNRARHPAYPRTVCGVVFQGSERVTGCQFTFTCDGALARPPARVPWDRARGVAAAALNGAVSTRVGSATHYHTDWVAPYWAPRLTKIAQIGTHIFYRWPGAWGRPPAFTGAYPGEEPIVLKMAMISDLFRPEPVVAPYDTLPTLDVAASAPDLVIDEDGGLQAASASEAAPPPVSMAPPPPSEAQVVAEREVRRDTTLVADPLAQPTRPDARRPRPRVAAPSRW